jgi:hypothetical protein
MAQNTALIQQLNALQWNYNGSCNCSEPMDKLTKDIYTLKISRRRDLWNLYKKGVFTKAGAKDSLINEIKDI